MNQVKQIDLIDRQIFKGNFAYSIFFGFMPLFRKLYNFLIIKKSIHY